MKNFMSIGQIINTHGINGELKIYPLTDDIRRFRKLKYVYIDGLERKVLWCKLQNDKVILKVEGIECMNEAEKYKDKYIEVKREDAITLPEGNYFICDLIGCTVIQENGDELGKVYDVIQGKSNDSYWIKGNREIMIPALKSIVKDIDIEKGLIIIRSVSEWYED